MEAVAWLPQLQGLLLFMRAVAVVVDFLPVELEDLASVAEGL
jgi:hypothetical protein